MAGRIWIPPYKPLGVSTQAVPGGGYIKVDPSVAHFGESVLGGWLGGQGADGGAGMAQAVSAHLATDNEAVVKAADVRLGEAEQTLLFDPQNGYLNTQGQVALTHAPAVLEAFGRAQDRALAETADDDQRQMLQGLNERRLADFTTQVERHTAAERQRWYDEAGERRIAQMQVDARLHWSDDAMLRRALGTTRFEVREKAARKGWDTPLTEAALRQHTSRILVAAIEGAVERDPDRAQAVRTRYDQHIDAADRLALDALLSEAQTRRRADAASTEILNATPPDGERPTPQWRLRQAEVIAEPAVRAAAIRRITSAAAANESRARALAEQVLARVLRDGLTDPSLIPVREWVKLDAEHRQAIETRLDHNAAGTEPAKNPALVDELATEMTQAPDTFARRDLVPAVAHLPLPQWQRFRDWQAGLRRNDPATEDQIYATKRGLQIAQTMLAAAEPIGDNDNSGPLASVLGTAFRAALVEEIGTYRRVVGRSPDDAAIYRMATRLLPTDTADVADDPTDSAIFDELRYGDPNIHQAGALFKLGGKIARALEKLFRRRPPSDTGPPPMPGPPTVVVPPPVATPSPPQIPPHSGGGLRPPPGKPLPEYAPNTSYPYHPRILQRMREDRGPGHSFPTRFDADIIKRGAASRGSDGYVVYHLPGSLRGKPGRYEIGIKDGIIVHRTFRAG